MKLCGLLSRRRARTQTSARARGFFWAHVAAPDAGRLRPPKPHSHHPPPQPAPSATAPPAAAAAARGGGSRLRRSAGLATPPANKSGGGGGGSGNSVIAPAATAAVATTATVAAALTPPAPAAGLRSADGASTPPPAPPSLPSPSPRPGRRGLPSTYSHPIYGGTDVLSSGAGGLTGDGECGGGATGLDTARFTRLAVAGGLAGALSRSVTAPLDRMRVLLSLGVAGSRARYTASAAWKTMRDEKTLAAFFRGNGVNILKNVPETAIKLAVNDAGQRALLADGDGSPSPSRLSVGQRLAVGSAAGAVAQVAIYPLEVIQTRLAATVGTYRGIVHCAASIARTEGVRAFGRGLAPTLAGILPYAGIDITAFELLKERLVDRAAAAEGGGGGGASTSAPPPAAALLAAGVASSAIAQLASYPFGLVRTRLQMDGVQGAPRTYGGPLHCARTVVTLEGARGLYKGFAVNLAKVAPAAAISWYVFEHAKAALACPEAGRK